MIGLFVLYNALSGLELETGDGEGSATIPGGFPHDQPLDAPPSYDMPEPAEFEFDTPENAIPQHGGHQFGNHVDLDGQTAPSSYEQITGDVGTEHASRNPAENRLMRPDEFTKNGCYDPVHGCAVEGSVTADLLLVDGQTTGSCSLMAQEQFVERYTGRSIPESELIDVAQRDGVYSWWWGGGTTFAGLDCILDHNDVPHRRIKNSDVPELDKFLRKGCDALVCVDASVLYDDPALGPDAGHAIAVVGRGVSSWTGKTTGFYITDSNYPGTTRFLSVEKFNACWYGDVIAVPATRGTNPAVLYA